MNDATITLSDGRALGYQCLGDPDGLPLFCFHGTPGSRLELTPDDLLAQIPGVRVILPERPGYGLSDPKPERRLLDWPDDVAELADHLGLDRFAVAGASGGGPHALACAYRLARRVTMALVFACPSSADFEGATRGMALGNRLSILLDRYAPWLLRWLLRSAAAAFEKNPEGYIDSAAKQMAPPDRELLRDASVRATLVRDFREAYRQGFEAHAVDGALGLTSRDWGFDLRQIQVPVHLWHGEEDVLVSMNMARRLARDIPNCDARFVAGAAHLLLERAEVVDEVRDVLLAGT